MNDTGDTLEYAIGEARLGTLIVARSAKGVAAILIADDADRCLRDLRAAFPGSRYRWGVPRKRRLINMEGVA